MKTYYSIFSGIIYEVYDKEVKNLDEGQIPLIKRPNCSCKNCYGRGWDYYDKDRGVYNVCKCMRKLIDPSYQPQQIKLLPKI